MDGYVNRQVDGQMENWMNRWVDGRKKKGKFPEVNW